MITTAASALMVGAAVAQTSTSPSSTPSTPSASAPMSSSAPASADSAHFINTQTSDQWLASSFKGTDVIGPDNAKIGDVNDILFDKQGKIVAYVVGVGGFLGIGEKNVALAPDSFQVVPASETRATTGSGATTTTTASSTASDDVKLKLSMTKDQLKQAPDFKDLRASRTPATSPGGTGMAPRTQPSTSQ